MANTKKDKNRNKIGKYDIATKKGGIGSTFEPEFINKVNTYCTLTGINRTDFITE